MVQDKNELEEWYQKEDPWNYEDNPEDIKRKNILLSEIPNKQYKRVLDIGCGHGFITRDLPGEKVIGIDLSNEAIKKAKSHETETVNFVQKSIFELDSFSKDYFDLIIITGVLYPQYIGNSSSLIYKLLDEILEENGTLVSVHIDQWYEKIRFPYLLSKEVFYKYRDYTHRLEVYVK